MTDLAVFPKWQLTIIYLCRFAEPVTFSVHLPFIYFLVRDFHVAKDDAQIGFYVGLLTSLFGVAQFVSAIPWGLISDRFGRKPVIMIGLTSTTLSMFLFGFSKSYAFAITIKFLSGLMDGNIGVIKSMIQENTMHCTQEQRARAFSFLQVTFGAGSVVGVMIGGLLYDPIATFPGLFEYNERLRYFVMIYPAFLPCFASACISSIGLLFGAVFLKETLIVTPAIDQEQNETTPLLNSTNKMNTRYQNSPSTYEANDTITSHPNSFTNMASKLKKSLTESVLLICSTYGMIAFQNVFYDTLFIIWSPALIDQGGIGLTFIQMSLILTISGVVTLVTQLVFFHKLVYYFGTLKLLHWTLLISIVVFSTQGFTRLLYYLPIDVTNTIMLADGNGAVASLGWIVWSAAATEMVVKTICQTIMMTSSVMLINDSAPTLDSLGTINGFSLCIAALTRAAGPALCGFIWSSTNSGTNIPSFMQPYIVWIILSFVGIGTFILYQQFRQKISSTRSNTTATSNSE
ncbi:major facilitator superfamily domain-containing protein [Absidia repens]|uniref:Major facilitator superfamily domain-containing protein n=1 Tax=Absidia repens TaxID=90262 RepID=A0A1X2IRK3_9FUNG|nr:major facilitator superfamily domain-containing protein [Absidia repens]